MNRATGSFEVSLQPLSNAEVSTDAMHVRERRRLQDALTAVRHRVTVADAGERLFPNGERHLRPRERLARLYPPELLAETVKIAALADFSLDELRYEYPRELVPAGETPASHLRRLTGDGAQKRWPAGVPANMVRIWSSTTTSS